MHSRWGLGITCLAWRQPDSNSHLRLSLRMLPLGYFPLSGFLLLSPLLSLLTYAFIFSNSLCLFTGRGDDSIPMIFRCSEFNVLKSISLPSQPTNLFLLGFSLCSLIADARNGQLGGTSIASGLTSSPSLISSHLSHSSQHLLFFPELLPLEIKDFPSLVPSVSPSGTFWETGL